MGGKNIRNKLLIVPGYIVGLSCLFLITYRTLIAFFSESKAVTIHINRFGEQFIDIFAIIIIWIICLLGFLLLIKILKEEKATKIITDDFDKRFILEKDSPFFDIKNDINVEINTSETIGILAESPNDREQKLNRDD